MAKSGNRAVLLGMGVILVVGAGWVLIARSQAGKAVSGFRQRVSEAISTSSASRAKAIAATNPSTDSAEYQGQIIDLTSSNENLRTVITAVEENRVSGRLSGIAEYFRSKMILKLCSELQAEESLVRNRLTATRTARNRLVQFKKSVNERLQENEGVVMTLNTIASELQPGFEQAFQATRPVRQLLDEANRTIPLWNESPLSLARRFDPNIGTAADVLEFVCSGIEITRGEIARILEFSRPFISSMDAFRSTHSRRDVQNLAAAAKSAASYCSSKITMFDPVLSKLDQATTISNLIYQYAGRLTLPGAANVLYRLAEASGELIISARNPFEQGKRRIEEIVKSFAYFETEEESYISMLNTIISESYVADATNLVDETEDFPIPAVESADRTSTTSSTTTASSNNIKRQIDLNQTKTSSLLNEDNEGYFYGFNEGFGSTFTDSNGSEINGIIYNGAQSISSPVRDNQGATGYAIQFNGINQYARLSSHPIARAPFTIMLWAKKNGPGEGNWIQLVRSAAPGTEGGYCIYWFNNNTISALVCTSEKKVFLDYNNAPVNTWIHIAVTYSLTKTILYINGDEVAWDSQSGALNSPNWELSIGGQGGGYDDAYFKGIIDGLKFIRKALGASEIRIIYNREKLD